MDMDIKCGDIFYADLNPAIGSEQGGIRPVLVIQNDIGNKYSPTTIIIPLTSKIKNKEQSTHTILQKKDVNGLASDSVVLCEQVRTIDKKRIKNKIGSIQNPFILKNVFEACKASFGF